MLTIAGLSQKLSGLSVLYECLGVMPHIVGCFFREISIPEALQGDTEDIRSCVRYRPRVSLRYLLRGINSRYRGGRRKTSYFPVGS
jgi:hypothetical protein